MTEFPEAAVETSLVARFEWIVARHAERVAVRDADGALTYAELNAAANRVARGVRERADAPGAVPLLVADDALAAAALLGAMKAGGAYVPLHPAHPHERNAGILADTGAALLLADRRHAVAARALAAAVTPAPAVVCIDDLLRGGSGANLDLPVGPDDACFVIYTSGSTGRPKGVCQLHRSMLHATRLYTQLVDLAPGDRFSLVHGLSTQIGATGIFAALLNGAAALPFDLAGRGLDALVPWLDAEGVTVLHPMPSVFRRLGARLRPGRRLDGVRVVRLVGEP